MSDEEARILQRLGKIVDKEPDSPTAALADGIIMLNHKVDMILENIFTILKRVKSLE